MSTALRIDKNLGLDVTESHGTGTKVRQIELKAA
jgi:hypothetical protein